VILADTAALAARRALATDAAAFDALATSLARDLEPLLQRDLYIPAEKARLTRAGGRCSRCGQSLDFDPWSPQRHRCAVCGAETDAAEHHGMWVMWYQLWLAERAVHAAALAALRGDARHATLARDILLQYAEHYLQYPNRDNVLGPTRVFFSTYLESMWTLSLACALDLLESSGDATLGGIVRERVLQPSADLIRQYDEGLSNNAALLACGRLLGDASLVAAALDAPSALAAHLEHGLLADGTWYEGENYHLFAHRGLWYGMTLGRGAGWHPPAQLLHRYRRAFETPFLTALPDFTFPARRDSQYRVSLRQWRIAESCELGRAENETPVLNAALSELYREDAEAGDTGRSRSTGEAERNVGAARLTRADLGWKSLLFADPDMPQRVARRAIGSVLLPQQGFAVLRRQQDRVYAALDYGESGGGHGHPDRLNLWLMVGNARILEDVGTGSYVDPSLHWYRSTLAHNAPLPGGGSQWRVNGELVAFEDAGEFAWVLAQARLAPAVEAQRAVVLTDDYLVDELTWTSAESTVLDLPLHVTGDTPDISSWRESDIPGGGGLEDGFAFVSGVASSEPRTAALIRGTYDGLPVTLWIVSETPFMLWRLHGPGPPNEAPRAFYLIRAPGAIGRLRTAIAWNDAVESVRTDGDDLVVQRRDGLQHVHARRENAWQVRQGSRLVQLHGQAPALPSRAFAATPTVERPANVIRVPAMDVPQDPGALVDAARGQSMQLGEVHYRRTEETWRQAGQPRATIAMAVSATGWEIDVVVQKHGTHFAPPREQNALDNEHPDVNSDGVQVHLQHWSWLLVPAANAPSVRVTPRQSAADAPHLLATWAPRQDGYAMRIVVPFPRDGRPSALRGDIIVNEMRPGRERRRGQLVLSGAAGEWAYLRGDRQDPARFITFIF
jgi:hypothetical protein